MMIVGKFNKANSRTANSNVLKPGDQWRLEFDGEWQMIDGYLARVPQEFYHKSAAKRVP